MKNNSSFHDQLESTLREDPGYALPAGFADGVTERIARKLAFRLHLRNIWRFALVLAAFTGLNFAADAVVARYFPQYAAFTLNGYLVAAFAFFVLFILFMDKVVLGYLELRK